MRQHRFLHQAVAQKQRQLLAVEAIAQGAEEADLEDVSMVGEELDEAEDALVEAEEEPRRPPPRKNRIVRHTVANQAKPAIG
jgi:hypothetical protein